MVYKPPKWFRLQQKGLKQVALGQEGFEKACDRLWTANAMIDTYIYMYM